VKRGEKWMERKGDSQRREEEYAREEWVAVAVVAF